MFLFYFSAVVMGMLLDLPEGFIPEIYPQLISTCNVHPSVCTSGHLPYQDIVKFSLSVIMWCAKRHRTVMGYVGLSLGDKFYEESFKKKNSN